MTTTYITREDAIHFEITEALGEHAANHNIDAIANETLGDHTEGFALQVDDEDFWNIVSTHATN